VQADIITMSFGVDGVSESLDKAITFALEQVGRSGHPPLIFASASNTGLAKKERSYPASDSRVICAYALDGKGNDSSGLNPPAQSYGHNFGTLGHGIQVKWKTTSPTMASGTSYATPILAAIVANYLDWLIHYDARLRGKRKYLRTKKYVEEFLKAHMAVKKSDKSDFMFIHPERCFSLGGYEVHGPQHLDRMETADQRVDDRIVGDLNGWLDEIRD
jgi:hypothetical protein